MKRLLTASLMILMVDAAAADPTRTCGLHGGVTPSPEFMAKTICEAAEDGRLQPSSDSLIGQCGTGAKDAAVALGSNLASFAVGMKDLTVAGARAVASRISSLWTKTPDPAKAAEEAAAANQTEARTWLGTVKTYAEASRLLLESFWKDLDHNLRLVVGTAACVPWRFKIQYACQFLSSVALDLAALKAVVTAVDKGAAATKAVRDFMRQTDRIDELKNLTFAERLTAARTALEQQAQFRQVERFGEAGNLRSRVDPITGKETLHFEEIAVTGGQRVSAIRDIPRDAKTLAIDANFEYGRRVAQLTVERARGEHLMFIDVNNLGKVNYFRGGTQAGDEYLTRVAENIRSNLRAEDRFFKNGGDELVVVLKTRDPAEVQSVIERIHRSIDQDTRLQNLFRQERVAEAARIRAQNTEPATSGGFQVLRAPTPDQVRGLQETARIRPSVSIGSTRIQGRWEDDLLRAERQAGEVKAIYKSEIGLETSKYRIEGLTEGGGPARFTARPRVMAPVD